MRIFKVHKSQDLTTNLEQKMQLIIINQWKQKMRKQDKKNDAFANEKIRTVHHITVEAEREHLYTRGTRIYLLKLRAYLLKRSYQEYMGCSLWQRQVLYYKARQY